MNKHYYTLITGASTGLGKAFAIDCARRGMNLILVALPGRNLYQLASDLKHEFEVDALAIEADLSEEDFCEKILAQISGKYRVNFLINNAGTGGSAAFGQASADSLDTIIKVNMRAMALLTKAFLPELMSHKQSYVLNVSSMAAFSPVAFKTVYPASKAFVNSFSRSLNYELKESPVSVTVTHPGPFITNFNTSCRVMAQGLKARLTLLPVEEIARKSIDRTLSGKAVFIPGIWNVLSYLLMKAIPCSAGIKVVSDIIKRETDYNHQAIIQ
ncbi:SDR family NAD(P)-dependent oxidoreductase [Cytophagaceae bacterium ABcell3]|nr:SDR family NAD(P)-dependent oxidoreductase [Cytophagaceae bacterium ABcell3]